jgi:hypothetical protein
VIGPTPLLDFFKRGEVERDVRVLAAQGALAPRAYEQLAILVFLLDDADQEIRTLANQTLDRIPVEALQTFLAQPDVPVGMLEFFGDRGVFPADVVPIDPEAPLLDADASDDEFGSDDDDRESVFQRLATMTFPQRLRAALKGSKEMRAILIRDPNKLISATVLGSPKITEQEIESFSRMATIPEDVLRTIAHNRTWCKNYTIVLGLTKNPKTPLAISLNLMTRLNARDIGALSVDRNVPEPLRIAARKRSVAGHSR